MAGRPGKYQPRFTAGELDPLMHGNTDQKAYYTGASLMQNARPLAQGGFSNMWGMRQRGRVRGLLTAVSLANAVATGPGAAPAAAIDGDPAVAYNSGALTAAPTEVLRIALPAAEPVTFLDIVNHALAETGQPQPGQSAPPSEPAPYTGALLVETTADGVTWTSWATVPVYDFLASRRLAMPPGETKSVMGVRLTATLTPAGSTFWLGEVALWRDTGAPSPVRLRAFTHSRAAAYDFLQTDGNFDVYAASGYVASIATNFVGAQVTEAVWQQQIDTGLMFHADCRPLRILRQGSDADWSWDFAPLRNVPNYDYGGSYTNAVAAVWAIQFAGVIAAGNHYTLSVNGNVSVSQEYAGVDETAAIAAALATIPGLGAGWTVTKGPASTPEGVSIPANYYGIEFSGAGNSGDGWAVSGAVIDNAAAAITATHLKIGVLGGEPIVSDARGWPACGLLFGGRLLIGGFKSAPYYWAASQSSDFWNFDTRLVQSTGAMLVPLDTIGAATIRSLHKGRTLYFFTDASEYWLSGNNLDRTQIPNIVFASTYGVALGIEPVEAEAGTIYVDRENGALMSMRYSINEQNYVSTSLSVEASALIKGVVDLARRRASSANDTTEIIAVRGDGIVASGNILLAQEVNAFCRRVTDGAILAAGVNDRTETSFVVERQVAGQPVRFLERVETGLLLDQAVDVAVAAGARAVAGLADLEGATVWAIADGDPQGPFVVSGGAIALSNPVLAAGNATIGRWTPLRVKTLPQPRDVGPRTVVRRPCRVHAVRLRVVGATSVAIGANDGEVFDVALRSFADPVDTSLIAAPVTGEAAIEGLPGFSDDGIVEITQVRPGLLTVAGATVEVEL